MIRNTFDNTLDRCVSMLRAGVTIEDTVAAYPAQAAALRERLAVAQTLFAASPGQQHDAAMLARARGRFLAAVRERSQGEPAAAPGSSVLAFATRGVRRLILVPYALPAVAAMVILGGTAAGITAGTGNSNPRAWFGGSDSSDHELRLQGTILSVDATAITITADTGEVTVLITPQTELKDENDASLTIGDFAVGDVVKISASREATGALVAHEVERELPDDEHEPGATATGNSNPGPGGPGDDQEGEDADQETPEQDDGHNATPESEDSRGPGPEGDGDDHGTPANDEPGDDDDDEGDDEGANHGSQAPVFSREPEKAKDATEPETGPDAQHGMAPELGTGHNTEPDDGSDQEKPGDGPTLEGRNAEDHAGDARPDGA